MDGTRSPIRSPWRSGRLAAEDAGTIAYAGAVADAMQLAGLSPVGAQGVEAIVDPTGEYRLRLTGVDEQTSALFTTSLDELLGPIRSPRYLVPRYVMGTHGWLDGWRVLVGRQRPDAVVWHAVPSVFATHATLATHFGTAWSRWISRASAVYAHRPEGVAALAASRGTAPLDLVTVMRSAWS